MILCRPVGQGSVTGVPTPPQAKEIHFFVGMIWEARGWHAMIMKIGTADISWFAAANPVDNLDHYFTSFQIVTSFSKTVNYI